jgi:hypothetical protein
LGGTVRCSRFLFCLLPCLACSDGNRAERARALPEATDFLPMVAETSALEQAQVVLRCEEGRIGAYLVAGAPAEVEWGEADARAVPLELDSVPSC